MFLSAISCVRFILNFLVVRLTCSGPFPENACTQRTAGFEGGRFEKVRHPIVLGRDAVPMKNDACIAR